METPVAEAREDLPDLSQPAAYEAPDLTADLVMKGGVTSGIVFPRAICELARRYRFQHIGGTSAGAIAAGLAAAAEHGRRQGHPESFAALAELPEWLGQRKPTALQSRLMGLFQPTPKLRSLFELLLVWASRERPAEKIAQTLRLLLFHFGPLPRWGLVPGLALFGLWLASLPLPGPGHLLAWIAILLATGLGFVGGAALALSGKLRREIPANFFGLCTGMKENADGDARALTPWLHEQIQTLAGRDPETDDPETDDPLTFGDLEGLGAPDAGHDPVVLRVMTTCLTLGRPYLLPFDTKIFYFDPGEFRRLFPEPVVRYMEREAARWSRGEAPYTGDDGPTETDRRVNRYLYPRLPLPVGRLPVVVAVRMSLSFPLLLSAVPLWTLDWKRPDNQEARKEWRQWFRDHKDTWRELKHHPEIPAPEDAPRRKPEPERTWFSDGGITSNFPVHLFDALLPDAPTFAINLKYSADAAELPDRVGLIDRHSSGLLETWSRFDATDATGDGTPGGSRSLGGFFGAMLSTMQNWTDNCMLKIPGYRDRIAHLHLSPTEGGLNLDMSQEQVTDLSRWGQEAGTQLRERFTHEKAQGTELSWDNHRWTRLRSALAFFQDLVEEMVEVYRRPPQGPWRSYPELVARGKDEHPTSYPWTRRHTEYQKLTQDTLKQLEDLTKLWATEEDGVQSPRIPHPRPELHVRPPLQK